jgi:hypothetical protein
MSAVSFPHYLLKNRHFRWSQDASQIFVWPPLDSTTSGLLLLIGIVLLTSGMKVIWRSRYLKPNGFFMKEAGRGPAPLLIFLRYVIPVLLVAGAARGTWTAHHLEKADSEISAWENVNELALNAVWAWDK